MQMRKLWRGLAIVAFISCGCGGSNTSGRSTDKPNLQHESRAKSPTAQASDSQRTIALSVLTLANPFFKEIADTMASAAREHGYSVFTVSGDNDPARQQNQVKDFIVQRVSAIVLTPCDSRAVGTAIKEANAAGIPVFTADIACLDPTAKVVCHVATDNYGGGREAAKAIVEALGGKGTVAILDYPEVESVILRTKGFQDELAEQRAEIRVVARLPGGGDREKSFRATQDILQAHPNINGIFAINDPSALGAIAALEKAGKLNQVKIVGFDGQLDGKQAIKKGQLYADPIQFPNEIGTKTLAAIVDYLSGKPVPKEVLIPTRLYRQADALKDPLLQ